MDPTTVLAIGTGLNFGSNLLANNTNREVAGINYELQKEVFEYQKELNQLIMEREDNAVQRRKADLIAAGFHPMLATGSSAGAGGTVSGGTAPQFNYQQKPYYLDPVGIAQTMTNVPLKEAQVSKTIEETENLKAMKYNIESMTSKNHAEILKINQEISNMKIDYNIKKRIDETGQLLGLSADAPESLKIIGYIGSIMQDEGVVQALGEALSMLPFASPSTIASIITLGYKGFNRGKNIRIPTDTINIKGEDYKFNKAGVLLPVNKKGNGKAYIPLNRKTGEIDIQGLPAD